MDIDNSSMPNSIVDISILCQHFRKYFEMKCFLIKYMFKIMHI